MLDITPKHLKRNAEDLACGRQDNGPLQRNNTSIPGTCEYKALHDKSDFADVLRELEMVIQFNHISP